MRKDLRMSYNVIDQAVIDRKRMEKTARKIDSSMVKHFFDYRPDHTKFYATEFVYDCMTV